MDELPVVDLLGLGVQGSAAKLLHLLLQGFFLLVLFMVNGWRESIASPPAGFPSIIFLVNICPIYVNIKYM